MKYFVVSDIHGHYAELIEALRESGFNEHVHTLIVLGDMFDRGVDSQKVYRYIKRLYDEGKAIVIKGNHELFLLEVNNLNEKRMLFNIEKNGFQYTLNSFCEQDVTGMSIEKIKEIVIKKNPDLMGWLEELPYYLETYHYIFVHAGLNLDVEDWRYCDWTRAVWTKTKEFRDVNLLEKGITKKVVHGHVGTNRLRKHDGVDSNNHTVYYSPDQQKIGIDGTVYLTKKVNVLIIEEDVECMI